MRLKKKSFRRIFMLAGILIFVLSISVFAAETDVAQIENGVKFKTLKEAYENAASGDTITLLSSASGEGIVIDKNITIDFGGKTYTFTPVAVGSPGTQTIGFQIKKDNTVTLKNGTLKVAETEEARKAYAMMIQNYADLTITDMTLDGTNLDRKIFQNAENSAIEKFCYLLSNNSGKVIIGGNTNIIANKECGEMSYALDVCKYASYEVPVVEVSTTGTIEGTIVVGIDSSANSAIEGTPTLAISSGTYTVPVSNDWCAEGFIPVDNGNGTYGVTEKLVDVDTAVKVDAPVVDIPNNIDIEEESFGADEETLKSAVATYTNSGDIVGNSGDAITALINEGIISKGDNVEVTVVVSPYIEISLVSGDVDAKSLEFDISAKYDVVVTTNSADINESNSVIIGSGDIKNIPSIEITLALPKGFPVNSGDTLYVHHTKNENGLTFVYEAKVSGDGAYKTITFTNTNGFSKFEVKDTNGVAKIGNTVYATLENAVNAVENNGIITLLNDNEEQIILDKAIIFTIEQGLYIFSGDITAGSNVTRTKAEEETAITYEFVNKQNASSRPSTGNKTSYRITVGFNEGGEISPKTVKVMKGTDKKFTIKAYSGYEIVDVKVDGKSIGKVNEYTFKDVKETHSIMATFAKIGDKEWENPFNDVKEDAWYYEAIKYVTTNGLFNGMNTNEFGPDITLTRGMLVTILYRLEGSPVTNKSIPFADVDMSKYYANPISWAKQNNIVNGIDEINFAPDAEITREQLATILYRYAKVKGVDVSVGENTNILSYDDANEISEYSIEALQWACGAGIMKGRTESTIVPKGNAKRCEVATMFLRFIEK